MGVKTMFQQGDQVVHRIHGAGTITAIIQPDAAPKACPYYELDLVASETRLMVPVEGAEDTLRPVSSSGVVEEALRTISQLSDDDETDRRSSRWRRRQRRMQAELGTGRMLAVAGVIQRLISLGRSKSLSFTERRTLQRAIAFLASELALAKSIPFDRAEHQVERMAAV
jgi:RNA polymerase-interacting CarD/CdnL/TRCF family regulator